MLAGRYPSDEFAELRPRLVWDRVAGTLTGRPGAQRLAVTSGGTIPDRGLFGVFLVGETSTTSRVGELDEEMVYESRVGDVFTLGSTSWRIEDITHDQVLVTPAPGQPGRLPFWKGDAPGRPVELGRALGAFVRELGALDARRARERGCAGAGLDEWAAGNLLAYLDEQREATGHLPDDRTIVVERFRDELGDWRVAIHSPFGAQVHAPWALAVSARLRERFGVDVQAMHSDDGIVLRLPDVELDEADAARAAHGTEIAVLAPDEVEPLVTAELGGSALFAARFRECAARALLLPRRNPGRRIAAVAAAAAVGAAAVRRQRVRLVPGRPRDDARVPAGRLRRPGLVGLMREVEERTVRFVEVETQQPSPFARSLLFGYVAQFLYEGDSPLAERRAAALSLDATLLAELLGQQGRRAARPARRGGRPHPRPPTCSGSPRTAGPATSRASPTCCACSARSARPRRSSAAPTPAWLAELEDARRAIRVRIAGEERWAAVEDAGRLRDALGVAAARSASPRRSSSRCATRSATSSRGTPAPTGRSTPRPVADRLGLGPAVVAHALRRLAGVGSRRRGRVPARRHRAPSGATRRCCGPCAGGRWPPCARRSSRCRSRRSPRSCRPGSRSAAGSGAARASCARSSSCRARRCRHRRSRRSSCRAGSPATRPRCSTSCAPPARCSGAVTARCPGPTGGCRCISPTPLP